MAATSISADAPVDACRVLEILYRDYDVVAVHKPAGLMVHRSELDRRETRFAVQLLRTQLGRRVFPAHRLDRGTSGDATYGKGPLNRAFAALFGVGRLLLACADLHLVHPADGGPLRLHAPLEPGFAALCVRLGWEPPACAPVG